MWWRTEKREVTEFLYKLLVADTPGKGYAQKIAARMGVPYPTLSKFWSGRRFPAALVRPLFLATDCDPRVAEFFLLDGSGYRLGRREAAPPEDLGRAVTALGALAGTVTGVYLRATEPASPDGAGLSRAEAAQLAQATSDLVRLAEDLRASFEALTQRGS